MKSLPFIFALLLSGCVSSMGWRKMLADDPHPPLSSLPEVALLKVEDGKVVTRVTNTMDEPISYYGYAAGKPATYLEERHFGRWVDTMYTWSGTGLEKRFIPSKGFQDFSIFEGSSRRKMRTYVILTSEDQKQESLVLVSGH
ncbi:hypothetical protein WJU23_13755 [Prosthecobacter sp. SYSU 5D2]|uniref:hypothetical protein n=1 Tax=Prosthecobacter sp. SYSU 5D2 TaxID=3134134 RepID=UPI0031FEA24F